MLSIPFEVFSLLTAAESLSPNPADLKNFENLEVAGIQSPNFTNSGNMPCSAIKVSNRRFLPTFARPERFSSRLLICPWSNLNLNHGSSTSTMAKDLGKVAGSADSWTTTRSQLSSMEVTTGVPLIATKEPGDKVLDRLGV